MIVKLLKYLIIGLIILISIILPLNAVLAETYVYNGKLSHGFDPNLIDYDSSKGYTGFNKYRNGNYYGMEVRQLSDGEVVLGHERSYTRNGRTYTFFIEDTSAPKITSASTKNKQQGTGKSRTWLTVDEGKYKDYDHYTSYMSKDRYYPVDSFTYRGLEINNARQNSRYVSIYNQRNNPSYDPRFD